MGPHLPALQYGGLLPSQAASSSGLLLAGLSWQPPGSYLLFNEFQLMNPSTLKVFIKPCLAVSIGHKFGEAGSHNSGFRGD